MLIHMCYYHSVAGTEYRGYLVIFFCSKSHLILTNIAKGISTFRSSRENVKEETGNNHISVDRLHISPHMVLTPTGVLLRDSTLTRGSQ